MNVYRFYFSTASNSPTLVPFSATCRVRGGVRSVSHGHTDWNPPAPNTPLGETSVKRDAWKSSIVLTASIPASPSPVSL